MIDSQVIAASITAVAALAVAVIEVVRRTRRRSRGPLPIVGASQPTWDDALAVADSLRAKIQSQWNPSLVIGLGRSGGLWGGYLAGNLGSLPFAVIDATFEDTPLGREVRFPAGQGVLEALKGVYGSKQRVLIVKGAVTSGSDFREYNRQLAGLHPNWEIKYAVLFKNVGVAIPIDFVGRELETWPERLPWHVVDAYRPFMRFRKPS